jgi:hypothetical protein
MNVPASEIAAFWKLFQQYAGELASYKSADNPVYLALLDQLHKIDPELYLEFCSNPGACELVITADGDRSLFPIARAVVSAAPVTMGWTIRALKPQIGCPEMVNWDDVTLRFADVVFYPLEADGSNELGLRIYVPGIAEKDLDIAHNALLRALDHILGEERFAEEVRYTEVLPLPANAESKQFIALAELDKFIRWRRHQQKIT